MHTKHTSRALKHAWPQEVMQSTQHMLVLTKLCMFEPSLTDAADRANTGQACWPSGCTRQQQGEQVCIGMSKYAGAGAQDRADQGDADCSSVGVGGRLLLALGLAQHPKQQVQAGIASQCPCQRLHTHSHRSTEPLMRQQSWQQGAASQQGPVGQHTHTASLTVDASGQSGCHADDLVRACTHPTVSA